MRSGPAACRLAAASALLLLLAAPGSAQRLLTLEDIYDPGRRINFSGTVPTGLTWIDDDRYLEPRSSGGGVAWTVVGARDGHATPLFDAARMTDALVRLADMPRDEARRLARSRALSFNSSLTAALLTFQSDLYIYDFGRSVAVRLTDDEGDEEVATFSPDGEWVAFVRDNDLHVVDTAGRRERALTTDGAEKILNGVLDWVYEEEIFGRGQRRGYWWAPDSSHIAFLRTDDTPVPPYVIVDDLPYDQRVERWNYPKPGDPNPVVTLGIASLEQEPINWVDLEQYPAGDRLVTGVSWTRDGSQLLYQLQNRVQNRLDVRLQETATGRDTLLLRETSDAWVPNPDLDDVKWLEDGSFLWLSARTGWQHIYHLRRDGTPIRQVTSGLWDVRSLHGIDERAGWIYFSGTERSYIGVDVYRIRVDGSRLERLSSAAGTHAARFSPGFSRFLDSWSDATTPTEVRLHRSDGSVERVIAENRVAALEEFAMSAPEFLQVKARDGFVMEAMLIKPPDFDASRRYPVYQFTYAGPETPQVRNVWGGSQYMYHQLLAQKGILVWVCDNRSASAKGVQSAWTIHRDFGALELRDIEDCLTWLKSQPYVDAERIGIHGWSYGGYMTSYALTHSRSFTMGIAGGTVSDWRSYDSVYTERYMGLPSENEEGYLRSAPRWAASNLHGSLLLIHGAMDENVHPANTMQFAYELQKARKPFELMVYPATRHGVSDPQLVMHLRAMMLAFTERHLLRQAESGGSPPGQPGTWISPVRPDLRPSP